ncbi:MAG: hypothetical protein GH151_06535 [Bacteroidetes bacterium]|nr:hypothetical protein [Bacteroidota bacterium]
MKSRFFKYSAWIILIMLTGIRVFGQFYNGYQMTFGKNRVQYYDFYWSFYRFEKFDTYYNEFGRELAEYTGNIAEKSIMEIEDYFDYYLSKRLIFIIYNKLSDFKQSNIGLLTGNEEYNTGGVTKIIKNKVIIFFQGDHKKYEQQIKAAITEVLINEMLYSGDVKDRVANSTLINLPDWYIKGLISYISNPWDIEIDNRVKDGILSGKYKKFNRLTGEEAVYAGHSFWRFLASTYGEAIIPNIIYLTRINKNVNRGFLYVLGSKIKDLSGDWLEYYQDIYSSPEQAREIPDQNPIIKKPKRTRVYEQIKISPDGKHIAYVTNESGQYKIWLYNTQTDKHKKILKKEPKIDQISDYSYPLLAWHPTGKLLAFITEEKGGVDLYFYRLSTGKYEKKNLLYFDKILDFSYSHDGSQFVFSAVKEGLTDIFVHNIVSGTNEQITRDIADDFNPRFIQGSDAIIFSSNRINDTLMFSRKILRKTSLNFDLFIYDFKNRSKMLTRLSEWKYIDKHNPFQIKDDTYTYLNNLNGIQNRYLAEFDSTISYVDTATHYRYFTKSYPLTNYSRNILEHNYSPSSGSYAEIMYLNGKYNMYYDALVEDHTISGLVNTKFRETLTNELHKKDSIEQLRIRLIEEDRRMQDTLTKPLYEYFEQNELIDINKYIFEEEKRNYYKRLLRKDYVDIDLDTAEFELPKIRIYETSFYNNYIANQVDFGFLNNAYQSFTGGAVYYNPGLNMLFKIGANDLFEDYKIIGGFRFAGNFDSNEYLLSFENLKGKFDKQFIFHRQAFNTSTSDRTYVKIHSHEILFSMRYPLNQVTSLKGTMSIRNDRNVYLATDTKNLYKENEYRTWASLKLEFIYDNTRIKGINLYNGTRFKIFGEVYRQIDRKKSDLFVLGADFRHYQKIHRDLIWANRLAASTSFGTNKLIYYLGGVDNWMNLFGKIETFDQSVPIDPTQKYVFQALATNMRGFSQNIRNGNSFVVINSEIRWPVFRYFINRPIGSNFFSNFQIVGFADLGTAWTGEHPYLGQNAYDKKIFYNGPITVTIDANREPVVAGFGFGLRSQIFGYFIRTDWAWGIENHVLLPRIFYLSLNLDF